MDFIAEEKDGVISVKAIVEKKGNDFTIHVPSFPLINKLTKNKEKEIKDGKRNI